MTAKTKSFFVLIGVLLIGILIGALGSSLVRRNIWQDRVERFRSPQGFSERLLTVIQPDAGQREQIEQILLNHHQKMQKVTERSHTMIKSHADSLLIDLQPILTAEQLDRLKNILQRRPPHLREHRMPPPDREE